MKNRASKILALITLTLVGLQFILWLWRTTDSFDSKTSNGHLIETVSPPALSETDINLINTHLKSLFLSIGSLSSTTLPKGSGQCLKMSCSRDVEKCDVKNRGWEKEECCSHFLHRLLLAFDKMFKDLGLEYYASFGTLLGAVRDQGHIPWTADVDVVPTLSSLMKFLLTKGGANEVAKKYGLHIFHWDIPRACLLGPNAEKQKSEDGLKVSAYVDIYPLEMKIETKENLSRLGKHVITNASNDTPFMGTFSLSRSVFFQALPIQKDALTIHGSKFPAPQHIERYLTGFYGNDYMTPDKHRKSHGGEYTKKRKEEEKRRIANKDS